MSESKRPVKLMYDCNTVWDSANTINSPGLDPIWRPIAFMAKGDEAEQADLGRKFAASLEMYDALKAAFEVLPFTRDDGSCDGGSPDCRCRSCKAIKQVEAALSKAEGRE